MKVRFDPNIYRNRKTVSVKIDYLQGIRVLYDWSDVKHKYIKRKHGQKYSAILKINGQQKEKYFDTISEAKDWRSKKSILQTVQSKDILFESLLAEYYDHLKSRVTSATLKNNKNMSLHLKGLFPIPVKQITPLVIDSFLKRIKTDEHLKLCQSTKISFDRELSLLSRVFNYYIEYFDAREYINPIYKRHKKDSIICPVKYRESKNRNSNRFMSLHEINSFISAMKRASEKDSSKTVYYLCALFQLRTGARIGEVCALSISDITLDNQVSKALIKKGVSWKRGKGTTTVIQNFTKTNVAREVYLTQDLVNELISYIGKDTLRDRLIFSFDGVTPVSYRSIQHYFDKTFKELGYKWKSSHILRHSFATEFLRVTRNQHALSKFLGHSNLKQTQHYAKITNDVVTDGFETFSQHIENESENVLAFKSKMGRAG